MILRCCRLRWASADTEQERLAAVLKSAESNAASAPSPLPSCCVKQSNSYVACLRATTAKLRTLHRALTAEQRWVNMCVELQRWEPTALGAWSREGAIEKAKNVYSTLERYDHASAGRRLLGFDFDVCSYVLCTFTRQLIANARSLPSIAAGSKASPIQLKWEALRWVWLSRHLPALYSHRSAARLLAGSSEWADSARDADRALDIWLHQRYPSDSHPATSQPPPASLSAALWALVEAERKAAPAKAGAQAQAQAELLRTCEQRIQSTTASVGSQSAQWQAVQASVLTLIRRGTARAYRGLLLDARSDWLSAKRLYALAQAAAKQHTAATTALTLDTAALNALDADLQKLDTTARKFGLL
jgi:hypothetical protein